VNKLDRGCLVARQVWSLLQTWELLNFISVARLIRVGWLFLLEGTLSNCYNTGDFNGTGVLASVVGYTISSNNCYYQTGSAVTGLVIMMLKNKWELKLLTPLQAVPH